MEDANFETTTANAAILRLTRELTWIDEMLAPGAGGWAGAVAGLGLKLGWGCWGSRWCRDHAAGPAALHRLHLACTA
jgi:hypothetical protein